MAITNGYCTLADVKAALRITDTVDDTLLELAAEAASRQIDGHTERVFYTETATRIFTPSDSYVCIIDDVSALTSIKVSDNADGVFGDAWTATDYQLEPLNGQSGGLVTPATQIRAVGDFTFPVAGQDATVQVTGTFGWAAVPTAVRQAAILLSSRQYKRYDSPLGVAGFGDLGVVRVSNIDPDIAKLLEPFMRVRMS
tara:strand:- start:2358 stop:2951 length:594 start_codon:yes stop_codon:yes gene_type:complete